MVSSSLLAPRAAKNRAIGKIGRRRSGGQKAGPRQVGVPASTAPISDPCDCISQARAPVSRVAAHRGILRAIDERCARACEEERGGRPHACPRAGRFRTGRPIREPPTVCRPAFKSGSVPCRAIKCPEGPRGGAAPADHPLDPTPPRAVRGLFHSHKGRIKNWKGTATRELNLNARRRMGWAAYGLFPRSETVRVPGGHRPHPPTAGDHISQGAHGRFHWR